MPLAQEIRAQEATDLIATDSAESAALQHFKPLIVPRHPQRFNEVQMLAESQGLSVSRRSGWSAAGPFCSSDAMQADVALLCGGFAPPGGQNLIDAAACGCPVAKAALAGLAFAARNRGATEETLAALKAIFSALHNQICAPSRSRESARTDSSRP